MHSRRHVPAGHLLPRVRVDGGRRDLRKRLRRGEQPTPTNAILLPMNAAMQVPTTTAATAPTNMHAFTTCALSSLLSPSSLLFSSLLSYFLSLFRRQTNADPAARRTPCLLSNLPRYQKTKRTHELTACRAVNWQAAIALMADDCLPPGDIREVLDTVTSTCAGYVAVVDIPPENIMEVGVNDRCAVRPQGRRGRGDRGGGRGFFFCSKTVPFIL